MEKNYTDQELCDMAMSLKPIDEKATFTAQQVRQMINYKVHELQSVMLEKIERFRDLVETQNDSDDDRVTDDCMEVVKEYLEMVEEEAEFSEFALI